MDEGSAEERIECPTCSALNHPPFVVEPGVWSPRRSWFPCEARPLPGNLDLTVAVLRVVWLVLLWTRGIRAPEVLLLTTVLAGLGISWLCQQSGGPMLLRLDPRGMTEYFWFKASRRTLWTATSDCRLVGGVAAVFTLRDGKQKQRLMKLASPDRQFVVQVQRLRLPNHLVLADGRTLPPEEIAGWLGLREGETLSCEVKPQDAAGRVFLWGCAPLSAAFIDVFDERPMAWRLLAAWLANRRLLREQRCTAVSRIDVDALGFRAACGDGEVEWSWNDVLCAIFPDDDRECQVVCAQVGFGLVLDDPSARRIADAVKQSLVQRGGDLNERFMTSCAVARQKLNQARAESLK